MSLVVADTGPLNYLIQIGHLSVLRSLIDRLVLPSLIGRELRKTNISVAESLLAATLDRDRRRRGGAAK